MVNKVRKVQVSIPVEKYDDVESYWVDEMGFDSVSQAAKVLLLGDLGGLAKQFRKLSETEKRLKDSLERLAANYPVDSDEFEHYMSVMQKRDPNVVAPDGVKGVRVWINEKGYEKIRWWR